MVNEINSSGGIAGTTRSPEKQTGSAGQTTNNPANSTKVDATVDASPRGSEDTVQLSDQAQDIARIQRALAQLPEIDEARVKEIRDQIANGTYTVDVEALAEKILADDAFYGS